MEIWRLATCGHGLQRNSVVIKLAERKVKRYMEDVHGE